MEIMIVPILLYLIAMLIGYVIYRRGFKLKITDLMITACGIIAVLFV